MKNFTFLALQGPEGNTADLAPITDAAQANAGRLSVVHIGPVPLLAYTVSATPYGAPIVPDGWVNKRNEMANHLAEAQSKTREYLKQQGLTGEVGTISLEPAALHDLVAMRSLFADISIVQNSLRENDVAFNNIVYGLLFEAPGPIILNVEQDSKALKPDNVLIAWNNSLPAARAIRAALPLLRMAKEVTIGCFDANPSQWEDGENPGADLATWLSHHGCRVTVQEYSSAGQTVGQAILERAQERAVDLIVMGAYGRSRWTELIFGGTTEVLVKQREYPVLLAH